MLDSEVIELFCDKLYLHTAVDEETRNSFLRSIEKYMKHGRKEGVFSGRTIDYLTKTLNELVFFLDSIGCTKAEEIAIITNDPSLLNTTNNLYNKYLFLGIIENEENTFRKKKLINKTKDYRVSLAKMYARYMLICETGYEAGPNWNNLVHSSDNEFAQIFVRSSYFKPYQMFTSVEAVLEYMKKYDILNLDLESYRSLDVNEELVATYESKSR